MIALDAAVRRLTVCQLTHESRGNGGGLRPPAWLRLRTAGGKLDPGWNLTIGRRIQFLLVLGHMKRTQKLLCMGLFSKIARDCDPSALSRVSMGSRRKSSPSSSIRSKAQRTSGNALARPGDRRHQAHACRAVVVSGISRLAQHLGQLGDVGGDAPGLVLGQPVGRRARTTELPKSASGRASLSQLDQQCTLESPKA
jgi:hypothetical protein